MTNGAHQTKSIESYINMIDTQSVRMQISINSYSYSFIFNYNKSFFIKYWHRIYALNLIDVQIIHFSLRPINRSLYRLSKCVFVCMFNAIIETCDNDADVANFVGILLIHMPLFKQIITIVRSNIWREKLLSFVKLYSFVVMSLRWGLVFRGVHLDGS